MPILVIFTGNNITKQLYEKLRKEIDWEHQHPSGLIIHAAAFDPSIKNISLIGSLISYQSVVNNKFYKIGITPIPGHDYWHPVQVDFKWGVASALTAYDLPDLIGAVAPRKVTMVNTKDQMLQPASSKLMEKEMAFPRAVYSSKNVAGNFRVLESMDNLGEIVKWSFE